MKPFAVLLLALLALNGRASELKTVSFFQDTVTELDGRVLKFLTGSVWVLDREIVGVAMGEAVMICNGPAPKFDKEKMKEYLEALPKRGVFMYRGQTVGAQLVSGGFVLSDGYLAHVVQAHGRGAILETDDGSLWSIPEYDQFDTGYWLPPYPVIIFRSQRYLLNLKEGKKVWIEKKLK
jgi:hypothetical protein